MKRLISIAALAIISSSASATAIPGLYRWNVPYADASMTTSEYLAERYGVEKADVEVKDVAIDSKLERYSAVAYVGDSHVCQVTLALDTQVFKMSNFAVKSADCVPHSE